MNSGRFRRAFDSTSLSLGLAQGDAIVNRDIPAIEQKTCCSAAAGRGAADNGGLHAFVSVFPSTAKACPEILEPASDAKNRAMLAMSCALIQVRSEVLAT